MTLYGMAKFLHVVGAMGMFLAVGLEWVSLVQLRRARTAAAVREWAQIARSLRWLGPASLVAVLAPGIYMAATVWRGGSPWIKLGFAALVLIVVIGALGGRPMGAAMRDALAEQGPLSPPTLIRLRAPLPWISLQTRAALLLVIVYLMTAKVGQLEALGALATGLVVAAAGCAFGLRPRPTEEAAK